MLDEATDGPAGVAAEVDHGAFVAPLLRAAAGEAAAGGGRRRLVRASG